MTAHLSDEFPLFGACTGELLPSARACVRLHMHACACPCMRTPTHANVCVVARGVTGLCTGLCKPERHCLVPSVGLDMHDPGWRIWDNIPPKLSSCWPARLCPALGASDTAPLPTPLTACLPLQSSPMSTTLATTAQTSHPMSSSSTTTASSRPHGGFQGAGFGVTPAPPVLRSSCSSSRSLGGFQGAGSGVTPAPAQVLLSCSSSSLGGFREPGAV